MTSIGKTYHNKVSFCNNCGLNGHSFHKCLDPITSLGIITFRRNPTTNDIEYLFIRRKDSLGFVDLIRGKYNMKNLIYLQNIIDEMTIKEKEMILTKTFKELWLYMWNYREDTIRYKNEMEHSARKFEILKKGIYFNDTLVTLEDMVQRSPTKWVDPEWGFPKGRRNYKETDLSTSYREFQEETGLNPRELKLIKNIIPFEEIFTGSNFKSYRSRYFLCYMDFQTNIFNPQDCEVGDIGWHTSKYAKEHLFRDTHFEKIVLMDQVDNCIKNTIILF